LQLPLKRRLHLAPAALYQQLMPWLKDRTCEIFM
jgi:hypothetical protein